MKFLRLFLLIVFLISGKCIKRSRGGSSSESPLLLTPLIKSGQIEKARRLSLVHDLSPFVPSYSGFLTVENDCDSNLWFWFFPSKNRPESAPVSVWLNGEPGSSSATGLFFENGPYVLSRGGIFLRRRHSWTSHSSIIYLDHLVGTGFSFARESKECYERNETRTSENFIEFLHQFFILFPDFKSNLFYLIGESWAGKEISAVAYHMLKVGTSLRLDGLAVGNAIIDPRNQQIYGNNLFYLGLVDDEERKRILAEEKLIRNLIDRRKFREAFHARENLLKNHMKSTGYERWFNYLRRDERGNAKKEVDAFLDREEARRALHVGNATRHPGPPKDFAPLMESALSRFEYVAERRRVFLYYGQMDLIASYAGASDFIGKMNWSGSKGFKRASRKVVRFGGKVVGYAKSEGMLTHVLVRNSGHSVPVDQPHWAYYLYNQFIHGKNL